MSLSDLAKPLVVGRVEVSPSVIVDLVAKVVSECYGVVGLAPRRRWDILARALRLHNGRRGVRARFEDGRLVVDVFVVLEYGTRIVEVARNIVAAVGFALKKSLGISSVQVIVNVQGLRISRPN